MEDTKRTKRVCTALDRLTLDEHIAERRRWLVEQRLKVPELLARSTALKTQADSLTRRFEYRRRRDLLDEAQKLDDEAANRNSMSREHDFESTVVSYLRLYHSRDKGSVDAFKTSKKNESIRAYVRQNDLTHYRQGVILDEYLTQMDKAPPKVAMSARDECPRCDAHHKLLLCPSRSIMSCAQCGYCVTYMDATSSSTSFEEIVEYSQYSYKRVNHYLMWLNLVQGKEAHRVPNDTLQSVMHDAYHRQGVRCSKDITQKRVRDSLRHLKLRKSYDHVAQIAGRLSGIRPPRISRGTEEELKNMFLQMQPAFQRHAPKTRTNFLSYSYVLYRCFQILGLTHMLTGLTLLKSRDKLEANDAIFRKMSEDLGWPVFDLPP